MRVNFALGLRVAFGGDDRGGNDFGQASDREGVIIIGSEKGTFSQEVRERASR